MSDAALITLFTIVRMQRKTGITKVYVRPLYFKKQIGIVESICVEHTVALVSAERDISPNHTRTNFSSTTMS